MRRLLALAVLLLPAAAHAATPLCVEVRSDTDAPGLRKLVDDELAHHPTHRVVAEGCTSRLGVELFGVAGNLYLTVRVNQEVPVRFAVKGPRDIDDKLSEALRQVLQHDPVYLSEDVSRLNAVMRAGTNVVRHGSNRYRIELFELIGSGGHNAVFASGGAFAVTRGIDHVQVYARLEVAGSPRNGDDDSVVLRILAGAQVGFLWEASARGNSSFYLGPGVGLHFLRFEGKQGGVEATPVSTALVSVVLRTGVRFLRFYGFDFDLFAQVHLPLYPTFDADSKLVDAYTPFAMAGLGVGF